MTDEIMRSIHFQEETPGRSTGATFAPSLLSRFRTVDTTDARRRFLLILSLAVAVLLTGCSVDSDADREMAPTGPPTITSRPSRAATELANRYRKAGGDADVSGIRYAKNGTGVLVLTVWTHKKTSYANFDSFATSLASFLTREGVPLAQGYVLNVYGPDGTRLHNYDTTPEHNP
ncbi:hypothetical protein RM550_32135 [Streptomyces sp. DSM 41527]|uniref:GerMN domain-containing protein n=1 Tax=Streptomyces mooreae TaxID=3075523 RepID=A0ABU2THD4_9ACTN|nr:hypothetical protein [Streptomyces sp. DSM 41527]MDT0460319.1 hypothetical protein [Streptomyces sp. DSM 41527]